MSFISAGSHPHKQRNWQLGAPATSSGPVPPPPSFVIYEGQTLVPLGVPSGAALTAKTAFLARLVPTIQTEDYESYANGTVLGSVGSVKNSIGGSTSDSTQAIANTRISNTASLGRYNTTPAGANFVQSVFVDDVLMAGGDFFLDFLFTAPVRAFGIYITNGGQNPHGPLVFKIMDGPLFPAGGVYDVTMAFPVATGDLIFWGFVNTLPGVDQSTLHIRIYRRLPDVPPGAFLGVDDAIWCGAADILP